MRAAPLSFFSFFWDVVTFSRTTARSFTTAQATSAVDSESTRGRPRRTGQRRARQARPLPLNVFRRMPTSLAAFTHAFPDDVSQPVGTIATSIAAVSKG